MSINGSGYVFSVSASSRLPFHHRRSCCHWKVATPFSIDTDTSATDLKNGTDANATKYFHDFYTLAEEKDLVYSSAFDEPWKLATLEANETVEAYFGLFTQRGLKDVISAATASLDGSDSATITAVGADSSTSNAPTVTSAASTSADNSTLTTTTSVDVASYGDSIQGEDASDV
ncbi:hypothetical protein PF010_g21563 [Phytophthora fragariae]|uniref:Uncharacterized protein n=1 Tax=Phytophthora fragariae TaxID=53985 RepID=A0A6A4A488_9STRA|nr:hypothetical protein PF003_g3872 [Phytophthora fragariae]KAE9082490.1 hypothetical protein PF010_g21563 [Phytophthora fragariae]KAE9251306.1 hypothetical protein PF002_g4355 [Phytophthora fragariae]KAE9286618.1 hypothetical protein PF001_g21357 [Phytophthora fragariae]